jgi:phosphoesterase RecJ-like protein
MLQFLPDIKIVGSKIGTSKDFVITLDCKKAKIDKIKSIAEDDKVNIIITPKDGHFTENDISFNKAKTDYDLIITVDTAELKQLRNFYENNPEMFYQIPVVNIDHHVSNVHFGKVNHVDIMASSTTEMLVPILEELSRIEEKELIDDDIATLLLAGIITDTGSFQNANTTPKAFDVAAKLVGYGARQQEIIQNVYKTKQLSQLKLWGRVLSKIQTDSKYHIVWSTVSKQDFKDTESTEDQTGDIIDELMTNAPEAEIVVLIKEKQDGAVSGSVRTVTQMFSATEIAELFGGGGHARAAGFTIEGVELRDAEYKVINGIKEFIDKKNDAKTVAPVEPEQKVASEKPAKKQTKKPSKQNEEKEYSINLDEKGDDVIYSFED